MTTRCATGIVQLLRNEYRPGELDTLVDREMNRRILKHETETMEICRIDTVALFRSSLDSLFADMERRGEVNIRGKRSTEYMIMKYLNS